MSLSHLRSLMLAGFLPAALLFFTGCATNNVTYQCAPSAATRIAALKTPMVAPLSVEVFELSAGGVREKRDDWTNRANQELTAAFGSQTHFRSVPPTGSGLDAAAASELAEVQALLQLITINHAYMTLFGPPELKPGGHPLDYHVGRIDHLLDTLHADGLLLATVHDEYSTDGRKALMVLGVLASAATGVVIVPAGGTTINSAALVERDGTVLWFNYARGGGDLRTNDGARDTCKLLLAGLPVAAVPH